MTRLAPFKSILMFMRHNRAVNGAEQPEEVARDAAAAMREEGTLNVMTPGGMGAPEDRLFEPDLMTIEAITKRHVRGGLDEGEWPDYEDKVPVGPKMP